MDANEKKNNFFNKLVEKGKQTGKLSSQDIDAAMLEYDLDVEALDKLYELLEANNIEIIDDMSNTSLDNFDFEADIGKTAEIEAEDTDAKNIAMESIFVAMDSAFA